MVARSQLFSRRCNSRRVQWAIATADIALVRLIDNAFGGLNYVASRRYPWKLLLSVKFGTPVLLRTVVLERAEEDLVHKTDLTDWCTIAGRNYSYC
jgi:hypothetical protein